MTLVASNSTRISRRFAELRASGELGIVAYIVGGDPSLDASLKYVLALAEAGADVIELGVPFSDPPVISNPARPFQLLQSDLANGPRKVRVRRRVRWRRWRSRHGSHTGRIGRLSPHSCRPASRHHLPRRTHFY